ncbi:DNA adenine methylase [Novosphingobium sp.]|uniref:DNA adenine methylase n=1 Tax=Novosphingobium sp. TaxID=1874826 RepID=UPI0026112D73|nr:DNA adenine methylase [Novosphingobium sp.]
MNAVAITAPSRPILRWHGGKWLQARWILQHFPPHRVYVEPFGGAWSVGFRKERSYAEIWNDLDGELVNLFRVLREPARAARLVEAISLTPFARDEFNAAYTPARGALERARRLLVRSFMGHGSDGASGLYRTGFRAASNRSGTTPAHDWRNYPPALVQIIERLQGVVIENRPAIQVMQRHDADDALHFVDPPYLIETRARANRRPDNGGVYRHELTDEQHIELLEALVELRGMVVLCGYPSEMYDDMLPGWRRIDRKAYADGALERTECLWLNPAIIARRSNGPLFESAA